MFAGACTACASKYCTSLRLDSKGTHVFNCAASRVYEEQRCCVCRVQLLLIHVPQYRVVAIASTLQRVRVTREHGVLCLGIRQKQQYPLETRRGTATSTQYTIRKKTVLVAWWDGGEADKVVKHGNSPHAQMTVLSASCSGSPNLVQIFQPYHKNCYFIPNDSAPGSRCGDSIFPLTPPHFI